MVLKFLKKISKAVAEAAKFVTLKKNAKSTNIVTTKNPVLAKRKENIQLEKLKLEYIQNQDNFDLEKLSQDNSQELQAFIQIAETTRLETNIDFPRWLLEQEKAIQIELLKQNYELQRELVAYQRETSLQIIEEQKRLENSPIWLVAADILNSDPEEKILPLRVFFAPPKLVFDRLEAANNYPNFFPNIELTLADGLRQFFINYTAKGREIDFLAGAWVSKSFHSEASIKALFGVLKSQPTLVLESEVNGNYLNFRIAYWSLGWSKYRYDPIISRLPYQDILYESAKLRARRWLAIRSKLIATGEKGKKIDELYGGNNLINLKKLQREQKFRKAGIDISELDMNYIVNQKDFEELGKFLTLYHCIFAGLVADEYFLVEYNLPPILPELLPDLIKNLPESPEVDEMMESVILYYQKIYQYLEIQRSGWMPELTLDLAQSLANLQNKVWAITQIEHSLKYWLKSRGLSSVPDKLILLLEAIESVVKAEDLEYVNKLNQCLTAIGETRQLNIMEICYKRAVSNFKQEDYLGAISDFDHAIKLNQNWGEAYYNRGFVYGKIGQYQAAINDFTQALQINENWVDAYNKRGDTFNQLGQYEQAITDYQQALKLQPDCEDARRNLGIVQGVVAEIKRQQQEEIKPVSPPVQKTSKQQKHKLENCVVTNEFQAHSEGVSCLAISPDGQILASGSYDDTIKLWQLSTGEEISTFTGHSDDVESVAFNPNGEILASGSYDHTIKLWQLSTGKKIRTLRGHSNDIESLAFSPNGQILASGGDDNEIKLWQVSTGNELHTLRGHSQRVWSVAFSNDGQMLASGSGDNTIKIWHLATGQEIKTLRGHSGYVSAVAFSTDGEILVSGSDDNTIKLWQLSTGLEVATLTGHDKSIWCLAVSPDDTLLSGGADNMIKIWQLSTGLEMGTLTGHALGVLAVAISPEGDFLVSGDGDGCIRVWR
ncbi:MAG: tetratricopeptide repeat protein [Okeania sp. SIO2G4]|uniref:WD40 domain-containing protein n=1 Tax=unclassified Okeania TaxID=2634635 RepID=UPI0013B60972|nr:MULTISPECIES: tetratricopeptide repeat protein [unclassified Okeania]NEP39779.1 tetratricopeptide repeat protein [Okeania sp. SIO2H7]NEP74699.1 tetratricopeptide repeat protein [Okeania sp. SIO2G5]NEP95740.1 tetratricopeptide repeat protein [Okeania sp. SIO2F5]NEQ94631.1 tetratricopeptide repeat protein [Okeania sp. SIO2G4]